MGGRTPRVLRELLIPAFGLRQRHGDFNSIHAEPRFQCPYAGSPSVTADSYERPPHLEMNPQQDMVALQAFLTLEMMITGCACGCRVGSASWLCSDF